MINNKLSTQRCADSDMSVETDTGVRRGLHQDWRQGERSLGLSSFRVSSRVNSSSTNMSRCKNPVLEKTTGSFGGS